MKKKLRIELLVIFVLIAIFLFYSTTYSSCKSLIPNNIIAENEEGSIDYKLMMNDLIIDSNKYPDNKISVYGIEIESLEFSDNKSYYGDFCNYIKDNSQIEIYSESKLIYSANWTCQEDIVRKTYLKAVDVLYFISFILVLVSSGLYGFRKVRFKWLLSAFISNIILYVINLCLF